MALKPTPPPQGRTILLVEDEPSFREVISYCLEDAGHTVLQAADGHEGYEIFRRSEKIEILITDYRMPKMSGGELIKKIHETHPGFPAVLTTGDTPDSVLLELVSLPNVAALIKPFRLAALLQAMDWAWRTPSREGEQYLRKSNRVATSIPCKIGGVDRAIVKNLGFGGCFVETDRALSVSSQIDLSFEGLENLRVPARVVWSDAKTAGFEFSPSAAQVGSFLSMFILNKMRQTGIGIMGAKALE